MSFFSHYVSPLRTIIFAIMFSSLEFNFFLLMFISKPSFVTCFVNFCIICMFYVIFIYKFVLI